MHFWPSLTKIMNKVSLIVSIGVIMKREDLNLINFGVNVMEMVQMIVNATELTDNTI